MLQRGGGRAGGGQGKDRRKVLVSAVLPSLSLRIGGRNEEREGGEEVLVVERR